MLESKPGRPGDRFVVDGPWGRVVAPGPRIAVISDIHGNLPAVDAVLADTRRRGADLVLCAGDLVGYGPWPAACVDLVREAGIRSVRGNYDIGVGFDLDDCGCAYPTPAEQASGEVGLRWTRMALDAERKAYLRELPAGLEVVSPDGRRLAALFHGSPRRANEYLYGDRPLAAVQRALARVAAPIALCGHTHLPYVRTLPDARLLVNCGSAGRPKHGRPLATYAWLDFGEAWHAPASLEADQDTALPGAAVIIEVSYPAARTAQAIRASGLPIDFADVILTGGAK